MHISTTSIEPEVFTLEYENVKQKASKPQRYDKSKTYLPEHAADDRKVIPCISVYPSRICSWFRYQNTAGQKLSDMFSPEEWAKIKANLKANKQEGDLSVKGTKRIKTAIDWLLHLSPDKVLKNENYKSEFKFKINFITLTLPSPQVKSILLPCGFVIKSNDYAPYFAATNTGFGKVEYFPQVLPGGSVVDGDDAYYKSYMLNQFLIEVKSKYNARDYIWRAESQKNGNIHFHILFNKYIFWAELQSLWNRILQKSDQVTNYHKKHVNLSEEQYVQLYYKKGKNKKQNLIKAFYKGKKANWMNPNSTDVHAVSKLRSIPKYLCKYFTKEIEGRRKIDGNLWRSSESLSKLKNIQLEVTGKLEDEMRFLQKQFPEARYCPRLNPVHEGDDDSFIDVFKFDIIDLARIIPDSELIREFIKYKSEKLKIPEIPLS